MPLKTTIPLNTLQQLNEYFLHHFIFTYNYGCQINFYTNKKVLFESVYSNDYLPNVFLKEIIFTTPQSKIDKFMSLFNTPNQYYSGLHYWHRDFMQKYQYAKYPPIISFVEVYHTSVSGQKQFIARHFIRNKTIIPIVSFIEDRKLCPYIKSPIASNSPINNWKKIINDSLFKNQNRNINLKEFVRIYGVKSPQSTSNRMV